MQNKAGRTSPAEYRALRADVGVDGEVEPSLTLTISDSRNQATHHHDQCCALACPCVTHHASRRES